MSTSTTYPTTLSAAGRHVARRFSFGLTPTLASDINRAGSARTWFWRQVHPESVSDPNGDWIDSWFPYLGRSSEEIYQRSKDGTEGFWIVMRDLSRRTVARRLRSTRQVHEVMVDFWSNLLHVPLGNGNAAFARADYDQMIRTYALTSFEELLQHAIVHPAMGINLSNNVSTRNSPNENLGRELLEVHTVGFGSGYTEDDVKASAALLTGYRVDLWPTFEAFYDASRHRTGPLTVMGFHTENASADGQAAAMAYLSYLARHPATALRIARRLCVKFVRDRPSDDLVGTVAAAYTANDTAIRPTLWALLDHPEFLRSAGLKLRTPQEDWQATVRALGVRVHPPTSSRSYVNYMYTQYRDLGAPPYEWPAPNGYPETNAAWASVGRLLNSFANHQTLAAQQWPTEDADIPSLAALVGSTPPTLQGLVDAYALRLLGEPATRSTSQAVADVLGLPLSHVLTAQELDGHWTRIAVVGTLLDSPQHMYR